MAEVTPIDLQRHLGGIEYPATKADIIEQARASGADDDVISKLETMPEREFSGPHEVMKEFGGEF
jgi:hypothetical protein